MPAGSRVRANNVFGITTDSPLAGGAVAFNSAGLANLPAITLASQHAVITLDPLRVNGDPEIIIVTAHTVSATVATITRAAYGTVTRAHPQGTMWMHTPIDEDYTEVLTAATRPSNPYRGQTIFETDTNRLVGRSTADTWQQQGLFFDPPACKVGNTGTQVLVDAIELSLTFNSERYDTDSMHDLAVNPSRITIRTAGLYLFSFGGLIAVGTPDFSNVSSIYYVNGSPFAVHSIGAYTDGSVDVYYSHSTVLKCAVNDYITFGLRQNNAANTNRNLIGNQPYTPELSATWIGRGN